MRKKLPDVTLICIDTIKYGDAIHSLQKSLEQIEPFETILFSDFDFNSKGIRTEKIEHLYSKEDYSRFCMKSLGKYKFQTSHILITQWDGHVLNSEIWSDEFLKYDVIGANWLYTDGHNCANGGFCLRSVRLHQFLAKDDFILPVALEDDGIGRTYRSYLEQQFGIRFAPDSLCEKFSFELREPSSPTFGFHGHFHKPYIKEPIVFKRTGAMGDVIALEPCLEHFHNLGHPIILDSPYYQLFARHYFPVKNFKDFDHERIKHRVCDLDFAYECQPKQLHLKSYFEVAGAKDYKLRNPKLNYIVDDSNRIFKSYVVIHIDKRDTTARNINGVDWNRVKVFVEDLGYDVIQIGRGEHEDVGLYVNTVNELFMMWIISGASLLIGVDSGPSCMAVALGVKSIISFGSVCPEFIHHDLSNITVLQSKCPIERQNCWHEKPGTKGQECLVEGMEDMPPCTRVETKTVIEAIRKMI